MTDMQARCFRRQVRASSWWGCQYLAFQQIAIGRSCAEGWELLTDAILTNTGSGGPSVNQRVCAGRAAARSPVSMNAFSPNAANVIGSALFDAAPLHTLPFRFFERCHRARAGHSGLWQLPGATVFGLLLRSKIFSSSVSRACCRRPGLLKNHPLSGTCAYSRSCLLTHRGRAGRCERDDLPSVYMMAETTCFLLNAC